MATFGRLVRNWPRSTATKTTMAMARVVSHHTAVNPTLRQATVKAAAKQPIAPGTRAGPSRPARRIEA